MRQDNKAQLEMLKVPKKSVAEMSGRVCFLYRVRA